MNKNKRIKHNVNGDIMFYFVINTVIYLMFMIYIYHYYNRKRVTILNFLILIFLLNVYSILIYHNINIIVGILITFLVLLIERFYNYLYFTGKDYCDKNKVFINRGNINFKSLIDNNYSYNKLITNLKKKGINDLSKIDYCALYNNELLIFKSDIKEYPINLVIDGKILKENLKFINKNLSWLDFVINENNLSLSDISLAFYKDSKVYFLTNE